MCNRRGPGPRFLGSQPYARYGSLREGFLVGLPTGEIEDLLEAITRVAAGETQLAPVPTDPVRARYAYRDQAAPTDTSGGVNGKARLPAVESRPS